MSEKTKLQELKAKIGIGLSTLVTAVGTSPLVAHAQNISSVGIGSGTDATQLMGKIIGLLLMITQWVGVAMTIYGVYETVMSFTQDMPDKRVKGITLALAGVVMIGLRPLLASIGVITG